MALKPFNSVGGFSVGEVPSNVILANGDVTATNLTTSGVANLNAIGNVKITGGTVGQVIITDGAGNLTFSTVDTSIISNGTSNVSVFGTSVTVSANGTANIFTVRQGNANANGAQAVVDGNLSVTGILTDNIYYANGVVWDLQEAAGANFEIQFNNDDDFGASANFTFNPSTNLLTVNGNANVGNLNATGVSATTLGGTLTTASQPNITSVGNLTSLAVGNSTSNVVIADTGTIVATGNITAPNFIGNVTGNISGNIVVPGSSGEVIFNGDGNAAASNAFSFSTTSNTLTVSNAISATLLTGTLTTASQPNVTSVGTLTGLNVDGNIVAANITANTGVFTGNGSGLTNLAGSNVTGQVGNALVAGTVYTADQPNITSVGTLTSLAVTGNTTSGNVSATGDVSGTTLTGTLTTAAQPNITSVGTLVDLTVTGNVTAGNVAGGNLVSANFISGTLTTAAQPNITSVGSLTSLTVTGTASAGNLSTGGTLSVTGNANISNLGATGLITATGNVSGGNLTTAGVVSATGTVTGGNLSTAGNLSVTGNANVGNIGATNAVFTGTGSFGGNVAMGNFNITGLADPVNPQDAATKVYVDEVAQGLKARTAADAYSASNLAATYDNGTDGVGATLTATSNGAFPTIDGVTLNTTTARRLLVAGQTNPAHNGLYVLIQQGNGSTPWILRRCVECDTAQEIPGSYVFINGGDVYANTGWVASVSNPATFVVGTDAINWIQFSGAGTYLAGTGLTLTGSTFSVNASQTQITEVGTLTGLNVNGNIIAANITANTGVFSGNGAGLTNIAGGNVIGQVGNALVAGTVYTNAQPNITSVGTLTSLAVTGNATAGNLYANAGTVGATTGTFSGNVTAGNLYANAGTVGASIGVFTTGNITTINSGLMQNGTSNVAIVNNGNVTLGVAGTTRITATTVGANVNGTLGVSGNLAAANISANIANLTTANVTGNVIVGSTTLTSATVTTTSTSPAQTIATFPVSGVTGVEFLVKGVDAIGEKFSVAKVVAVTDGDEIVDYTVFATVNIGTSTGTGLQVTLSGTNLLLQVTPSSSESTVWTTQYSLV
jgi:hypothetical protein